jgi:acetyl-CoA decarbonylase/synthase complex subunit delta
MAVEAIKEKWTGEVAVVTIGATKQEGGSRAASVKIGGQKTLPFLFPEGNLPYPPVIAQEIQDTEPLDLPPVLTGLLCVRLQGAHPDFGNKSADAEAKFIAQLLKKVTVPLVIIGCGDDEKDNLVLPAVCEAAKGERCLIGSAVQDNYKTLTAAVLADGHNIIAESPIDINIAKQLNILISDMSLPLERIVINPTIGGLGYGLEYAYSIMERARLAALAGDKTVANPFICFVAQESWRAKEAKADAEQGIMWEVITATALIQAGADILVMRHPKAIEKVNKYINNLMTNG